MNSALSCKNWSLGRSTLEQDKEQATSLTTENNELIPGSNGTSGLVPALVPVLVTAQSLIEWRFSGIAEQENKNLPIGIYHKKRGSKGTQIWVRARV